MGKKEQKSLSRGSVYYRSSKHKQEVEDFAKELGYSSVSNFFLECVTFRRESVRSGQHKGEIQLAVKEVMLDELATLKNDLRIQISNKLAISEENLTSKIKRSSSEMQQALEDIYLKPIRSSIKIANHLLLDSSERNLSSQDFSELKEEIKTLREEDRLAILSELSRLIDFFSLSDDYTSDEERAKEEEALSYWDKEQSEESREEWDDLGTEYFDESEEAE